MTNTMKMMEINDEMLEAVNGGVSTQPDESIPRRIVKYEPSNPDIIIPWVPVPWTPKQIEIPGEIIDFPIPSDDEKKERKISQLFNSSNGSNFMKYID